MPQVRNDTIAAKIMTLLSHRYPSLTLAFEVEALLDVYAPERSVKAAKDAKAKKGVQDADTSYSKAVRLLLGQV